MTIRQLRTLVAVADAKTFSAAAEVVHVTHAAVSQQMQSLEAELGVVLFDRTPRTPELTPAAREIVAKARKLIAEYDGLAASVHGDGALQGVLNLGVMRTTLTGLTPRAVAILKAKFPDLGLHLRTGLTRAHLSDIERGQLDAALVSKPHQLPLGLVFRTVAEEQMHLIAGPEDAGRTAEDLLRNRPFIRFDRGAVVGALIDNWIVSKGIKVTEAMELDSPEAIASMVHAGLGVSIVPDLVVKAAQQPSVFSVSLGQGAPTRTLGLVHRDGHPKRRALNELHEAFLTALDPVRKPSRT